MSPARRGRSPAYRDAVRWLESLIRTPPRTLAEREKLGLAPIESLLDRIGAPHRGLAAIHITGSKGKGSTALYTEALLTAASIRTGTFTSPHLEEWTERIRVGAAPISAAGFVAALERIRPAVAQLQAIDADAAPAFFDALVAAAFSTFVGAAVDVAVVEAGVGARLDPTRACRATVTCVTSVELEHTDRLGPTLADIAREKAAIARPGVPLVTGSLPEAARTVLEREAARVGAPVLRLGRDITVAVTNTHADADAAEITLADRTIPIRLRQPGRHMLDNAALALALANEAGALNRLDDSAARAALEAAALPGRLETLRETPLVIADGAHTRKSIEALVEILDARTAGGLVAVVSITRGKDAAEVLSPLVGRADTVIATAANTRSLPASELARILESLRPRAAIARADTPADAIHAAIDAAGSEGTICVTGSMYMAGAARRILSPA